MRKVVLSVAAVTLLMLAAVSGAGAAGFCNFSPYSSTLGQGWTEIIQWNAQGVSITPTCWQATIPSSSSDIVSVAGAALPTAVLCTTGSWGGDSTVLMWLDSMSSPSLPGTPLPCPYTGYFAFAVYGSQNAQVISQAAATVNVSAVSSFGEAQQSDAKTSAMDKPANIEAHAAPVKQDAGYCTAQPVTVPLSSVTGGVTPEVWWSQPATQFTLGCFRATVTGTTPWPVELWLGCTSELYQGAGNVTLIARLPSNYLPSGLAQPFVCPFTGYFAVFVKSRGQPAHTAALSVNLNGNGYSDNATIPEAAMPRPGH